MSRTLRRAGDHWVGEFTAMASPCQLLTDVQEMQEARRLLGIVAGEAARIEEKFSRYRSGNIVHAINSAGGEPVEVDEEMARLLDFAGRLHELSNGRFDITSGVLGRIWSFDGSDRVPDQAAIDEVLALVGWQRAEWDGRTLRLEPGMQIDLGGLGKEYAVDRAAQLVAEATRASCLVNFGGDLRVTRPRTGGEPWRAGIEDPSRQGGQALRLIRVSAGGLATSGDTRRFLLRDGVRYGHILDPTTGRPVEGAPRSVSVAAGSCIQAGMLATFAMLQGKDAETFLEAEGEQHWVFR